MKYIKSLILTYMILFFIGVNLFLYLMYNNEYSFNEKIVSSLITGDLALIEGDSYKSRFVKFSDCYSHDYSHIGFVIKENNGSISIVHMSIDAGCIVWEDIEDYVKKSKILNMDFYRINDNILYDKSEIYNILKVLKSKNIKFDYSFDIKDSDRLYCTELIIMVLKELGFNYPIKDRYIYPSEMTKNNISQKISLTN